MGSPSNSRSDSLVTAAKSSTSGSALRTVTMSRSRVQTPLGEGPTPSRNRPTRIGTAVTFYAPLGQGD